MWNCGTNEGNAENKENRGGNARNVDNRGGNAGNQGENVSIVVEMTYNSNGYNTFKEWREFKIK